MRCARCRGHLSAESDLHGKMLVCINCGAVVEQGTKYFPIEEDNRRKESQARRMRKDRDSLGKVRRGVDGQ